MGWIGPREVLLIVVVVLLLFGAKRIPELMRSIGGGFREFKKGIAGDDDADADPTAEKRIEEKDENQTKSG